MGIKFFKCLIIFALLIALPMVLIACGEPAEEEVIDDVEEVVDEEVTEEEANGIDPDLDPVLIGCLIPFTGVETHNGLSMQYGAEIAAEMINANGGINGREVQLILEDTTGSASVAEDRAIRMVEDDNVDVLIGTLASSETYAVFEYAQEQEIIFMNPTFYTGELHGRYFFATGATPNQVIYPLMDYALEELDKNSYYFIGSDYVWGYGSIAAALGHGEEIGAEVVNEEYVPFGTTDFSSNITRIMGSDADIIFPFVAGLDGATFLQQLYDFGATQDYLIVGNYLDELLVPALPAGAVEGIVNTSGYYTNIDTPENAAFLEKVREYDSDALMGNFGANMYHNLLFYAEAANAAGTTETEAVIEALQGLTIQGLTGPMTIDPETQHAIQNIYMAEIQPDKSFEIIKVLEQVVPLVEEGLTQ